MHTEKAVHTFHAHYNYSTCFILTIRIYTVGYLSKGGM